MKLKKIFEIDNKWFFTELPPILKLFSFFVRGDLLVLLPLIFLILSLSLISQRFMWTMVGVYISVRFFGEMIYWFAHQFNERKYRPYDLGFKKLDNHAIYIIYQTCSIFGVVTGLGIVIFNLFFNSH